MQDVNVYLVRSLGMVVVFSVVKKLSRVFLFSRQYEIPDSSRTTRFFYDRQEYWKLLYLCFFFDCTFLVEYIQYDYEVCKKIFWPYS